MINVWPDRCVSYLDVIITHPVHVSEYHVYNYYVSLKIKTRWCVQPFSHRSDREDPRIYKTCHWVQGKWYFSSTGAFLLEAWILDKIFTVVPCIQALQPHWLSQIPGGFYLSIKTLCVIVKGRREGPGHPQSLGLSDLASAIPPFPLGLNMVREEGCGAVPTPSSPPLRVDTPDPNGSIYLPLNYLLNCGWMHMK